MDGPSPTVMGSSIISTSENDTCTFLEDDEEDGERPVDPKDEAEESRLQDVDDEL